MNVTPLPHHDEEASTSRPQRWTPQFFGSSKKDRRSDTRTYVRISSCVWRISVAVSQRERSIRRPLTAAFGWNVHGARGTTGGSAADDGPPAAGTTLRRSAKTGSTVAPRAARRDACVPDATVRRRARACAPARPTRWLRPYRHLPLRRYAVPFQSGQPPDDATSRQAPMSFRLFPPDVNPDRSERDAAGNRRHRRGPEDQAPASHRERRSKTASRGKSPSSAPNAERSPQPPEVPAHPVPASRTGRVRPRPQIHTSRDRHPPHP
jgi:hypothetical protein